MRWMWLIIVLSVVNAACDRGSGDSGSGSSGQGGAGPAEVRVGYFANLTHAQGVLGVASGEFEQAIAPAKLTTRVFNAGPSLIEALFAGAIDIGYVGPGPAIHHFGIEVEDTAAFVAKIEANGGTILENKPGDAIKYRAPDGTISEIVEVGRYETKPRTR